MAEFVDNGVEPVRAEAEMTPARRFRGVEDAPALARAGRFVNREGGIVGVGQPPDHIRVLGVPDLLEGYAADVA